MKLWKREFSLETLNQMNPATIHEAIGIQFTGFGEDYLEAEMPVDARTHQPAGLLHGGASVVLAESLGSVASLLCLDSPDRQPVGLEVNANHLRSVRSGKVFGRVEAIQVGRTVHVWQIRIRDEKDRQICLSRLTVAIIDRPKCAVTPESSGVPE